MTDKAYYPLDLTLTESQEGVVSIFAPVTGNLVRVHVISQLVVAGGDALFDVNKNGSTVFGSPTDRVKVEDGDSSGDASGLAVAVTQYTDVVSVDFDGFSGGTPSIGGPLTVVLEFEETAGAGTSKKKGRVYLGGTPQTLSNAATTNTQVLFDTFDDGTSDTDVDDPDGLWDDTNHNWVIPDDGEYLFVFEANFVGNATGVRRLDIRRENLGNFSRAKTFAFKREQAISTGPVEHVVQCVGKVFCLAGEVVYARAGQNSGGTLNLQSDGFGITQFHLIQL
jgi:hypothetical protein